MCAHKRKVEKERYRVMSEGETHTHAHTPAHTPTHRENLRISLFLSSLKMFTVDSTQQFRKVLTQNQKQPCRNLLLTYLINQIYTYRFTFPEILKPHSSFNHGFE